MNTLWCGGYEIECVWHVQSQKIWMRCGGIELFGILLFLQMYVWGDDWIYEGVSVCLWL